MHIYVVTDLFGMSLDWLGEQLLCISASFQPSLVCLRSGFENRSDADEGRYSPVWGESGVVGKATFMHLCVVTALFCKTVATYVCTDRCTFMLLDTAS